MIYSKRWSCRFMSLACLLGMASASVKRLHKDFGKWTSAGDLHNHAHPSLKRSHSAPARNRLPRELRMTHSPRSAWEESAETRLGKWAEIVRTAEGKYIMFDLDQAILHRDNGCSSTETRETKGKPFITKQDALDRAHQYHIDYPQYKHLTVVVSKLPVGTGRKHPSAKARTWLLVVFRPGIEKVFAHARRYGWTIGVNTAMNPVHGQPIVKALEDKFDIKVKPEHRYFRMSTVRDTDPDSDTYGAKNIKDYDRRTWLIQLDFHKDIYKKDGTYKWFYQYMSSEGEWKDIRLNLPALKKFCPDWIEGKCKHPIQDNMLPTYLSDELQRILDGAEVYKEQMTAQANWMERLKQASKDWLPGFLYSEEYRKSDEYKNFNYKYSRNDIDEPLWRNNLNKYDASFQTIHERLGKNSCIVHFDDKDFDVRLPIHDDEGNCPSLPWYPQSCLEDPKKAKKVKSEDKYLEDLEHLMELLC